MHWIVQLSLREHQLQTIHNALRQSTDNYSFIGHFSETSEVMDIPIEHLDEPWISLSGVRLLRDVYSHDGVIVLNDVSKEIINQKLRDSYFYKTPEKFSQHVYAQYDIPLLNQDSIYLDIADNLNISFDEPKFLKPSSDLKSLNAGIINANERLEDYINRTVRMKSFWKNDTILVSSVKRVKEEYRFFVVGDEVISGSQYTANSDTYLNTDIPRAIEDEAHNFAKRYQPDDAFVMDLCRTDDNKIRVIEYNCANTSGFYKNTSNFRRHEICCHWHLITNQC